MAHEVRWWVKVDQISPWMVRTGSSNKDLLAWTKCLCGQFGQDQMSANQKASKLCQCNKPTYFLLNTQEIWRKSHIVRTVAPTNLWFVAMLGPLRKTELMPIVHCSAECRTSRKRQHRHALSWVEPGLDAAADLPSSGEIKPKFLPGEPETASDIWGWDNSTVWWPEISTEQVAKIPRSSWGQVNV